MRCPNCQNEIQPGQKFCPECGARLDVGCATCGAALPANAKFCPECGTATSSDSAATGASAVLPPEPVAERRLVSVLFADLVGFTSLSEGRDSEDTRDLLDRYFELARERIERYGGTVEKFIGDAVMAVWGAPQAFEDDAERAVRAALDLVADVGRLGTAEQPVLARAAVLTGEAAVTIGAQGQGMVAGDLVNSASRLQSLAEAGTVLVGEATQRASAAAIAYETLGERTLRGKALPLEAWQALRVVARRGGRGRSDGLEAPFVGRDDELGLLKDLYHSTVRERRARVVSVTGQAGIGKTRLAWELLKYLDGLSETLYWHQGRSPAFGEGVSFWALGEMIRSRAGILEDEGPELTSEKLRTMLGEYVGDAAEERRIEPALRSLLGLEVWTAERGELFGAWRSLFERIAARGAAAVLVFEDLQWADPGLVDFIEELAARSRAHPILVITLARPEFLERRPTWGAGQRNFTSLHLEPLDATAMTALLDGLVPGLPVATQRAIVGRAEGVPLYAVEIVRMLVADESLVREGDRFRVARPLDRLAIPESLQGLVAARLDALEGADRTLLQEASVLGQSFTLAAIASLTGDPVEALRERLDDLADREWLLLESDPQSPERGQYQFVQGVIREVAYQTLAKRDRRARHLAAARYFESLGDAELPGLLATHYLAAYRNTPPGPDADALAAQARVSLKAAAERAASLGSHGQSLSYLKDALEITDDPPERIALLTRAGHSATFADRYDEAIAILETAFDESMAIDDRPSAAEALAGMGTASVLSGRPAAGMERMAAGLALIGDGETPGHARLYAELARARMLEIGPYDEVAAACDRALAVAERLDLVSVIANVLITKGTALARHHAREGVALLIGALSLAESRDDVPTQLRAINNVGAFLDDDDPARSKENARRGLELARRTGSVDLLGGFTLGLIWAAWQRGHLRDALALSDEVADEDIGPFTRAQLETGRERLQRLLGDDAAADETHRTVEAVSADVSHREFIGYRHYERAELALLDGRPDEALRFAEAFLAAGIDESNGNFLASRCALRAGDVGRAAAAIASFESATRKGRVIDARQLALRACLTALEGREGEALEAFAEATRAFRELELRYELAMHQWDLVAVMAGTSRVVAIADEAGAAFDEMGAHELAERMRAAAAHPAGTPARAPGGRAATTATEVGASESG